MLGFIELNFKMIKNKGKKNPGKITLPDYVLSKIDFDYQISDFQLIDKSVYNIHLPFGHY